MMASAEKKTVTTETFTLVLSSEEAAFLLDLLFGHVNGTGPRKHSNDIGSALDAAGVDRSAMRHLGSGIVSYKDPEPVKKNNAPLQVGDRVKVIEDWTNRDPSIIGDVGKLTQIDPEDDGGMVYEIEWPDGGSNWVKRVERVTD
jgi:hypothetical protein